MSVTVTDRYDSGAHRRRAGGASRRTCGRPGGGARRPVGAEERDPEVSIVYPRATLKRVRSDAQRLTQMMTGVGLVTTPPPTSGYLVGPGEEGPERLQPAQHLAGPVPWGRVAASATVEQRIGRDESVTVTPHAPRAALVLVVDASL